MAQITRKLLEKHPLADLPGYELRLFHITYPPEADASGHSHPVIGLGLMLKGCITSAFDDGPEETLTAGQSFTDPASFHRVSRNASDTEPAEFVIAYTARVGEPNTTWPDAEA